MSTLVVLTNLKLGDVIDATGEIVLDVQHVGPLVIIDFTDGTATAPLMGNLWTWVR